MDFRIRNFLQRKKRSGITAVVRIAIGVILVATLGMVALQILATAGTTSFQPSVTLIMLTVVPIIVGVAFLVSFLREGGISI